MNFPFSLVTSFLLVAAALALQQPNASNSTCIVKRNVDGRMLQLSELLGDEPHNGIILFTLGNGNDTKWNLVPVENSTDLFRLRNIKFDQYLAITDPWCTSYPEGYGNYEDYVWRWEAKTTVLGDLIHNSTNKCMDVSKYEDPFGGATLWYPFMTDNCTSTESLFAISCLDSD